MKQIFLSVLLSGFLACKTTAKKEISGIGGEYGRSSNVVTITDRKGKVDVSICFASEACIEPCFVGLLVSVGNKRYSGWVYPETEDSTTENRLLVISFYKNELEVIFPQGTGPLGASCDPAGVYKKK